MNAYRRTAVVTGGLFIVATAASLAGTAVEQSVMSGGDYLARIPENTIRLSTGGFFEFVAAGASVAIPISLYPVLKSWSGTLALGAIVFRTVEAAMYTAAAVSLLSLLSVAQQVTNGSSTDRGLQALGDSLLGARQEAILAGVFAFVVGALMYYYVFYRARLVPTWLSGWGIVGALLLLAACLLALFTRHPVTTYTMLILPIALQEMVLAVWLIAKGFRTVGPVTQSMAAA